jgi:hypothetical protein
MPSNLRQAAVKLQCSSQWLTRWLRMFPRDDAGVPYYQRRDGEKVFTDDDIERIRDRARKSDPTRTFGRPYRRRDGEPTPSEEAPA